VDFKFSGSVAVAVVALARVGGRILAVAYSPGTRADVPAGWLFAVVVGVLAEILAEEGDPRFR